MAETEFGTNHIMANTEFGFNHIMDDRLVLGRVIKASKIAIKFAHPACQVQSIRP